MMASTKRTFDELRAGNSYRVVSTDPTNPNSQRFEELGLTQGTEFRVVKIAPFGDPVEIDLRGYRLCLRRRDAAGFVLESLA